MVKIDTNGYNMYLNHDLIENLNQFRHAVEKKDMDYLSIVTGNVGTGKSCLVGGTLAPYLDPTFRGKSAIRRMCQTPEEFREEIMLADKFQAVVFDEAITGTASRRSMAKTNFIIFSMLEQIRQKNLYIFITIPNWYSLDQNIAIDRATSLYYVYVPKNRPFHRGNFGFFNRSRKHQLWIKGKKNQSYNPRFTASANFIGSFTHQFPFNEETYKKKKMDSFKAYVDSMKEGKVENASRIQMHRDGLIKYLYKEGFSQQKISEIIEENAKDTLDQTRISQILRENGLGVKNRS